MPRIKTTPEDFVVDEIPAYEPCGEGEHLFVHFRKENRTTDEVVSDIARGLDIRARDIGVAGLKDKVGVTTQTISVSLPPGTPGNARGELEARVRGLAISGVTVLDAKWHKNKLKTGHLRGNRFHIVIRDVGSDDDIAAVLGRFEAIAKDGVPNAFGPQRFGWGGKNLARAEAWLSGKEPGPRDPKARRFSFSVWQSAMFNRVLERRVADGTWCGVLEGDLLVKHATGGLFLCEDVATDAERARALEISATGPMIGDKMRWPEGRARVLEEQVLDEALSALGVAGDSSARDTFLATHARLGEGTRRPLRQWVGQLAAERQDGDRAIRVEFVLPSGAYATTVLSRAFANLALLEGDREGHGPSREGAEEERTELSS